VAIEMRAAGFRHTTSRTTRQQSQVIASSAVHAMRAASLRIATKKKEICGFTKSLG